MKAPDKFETERLILRPYDINDVTAVYKTIAQDREVSRYLGWKAHDNYYLTKAYVKERISAWDQGDDFTWAVTLRSGDLIGGLSLRIRGMKGDFGFLLGKEHWNRGYMTEALKPVVEWALDQDQLYRLWAVCDIENLAAARVLEKCGFSREGILKKWGIHPQISNVPRDCYCYSVVRD